MKRYITLLVVLTAVFQTVRPAHAQSTLGPPPEWVIPLAREAYVRGSGRELPAEWNRYYYGGERDLATHGVQCVLSPCEERVLIRSHGKWREEQILWVGEKKENDIRELLRSHWGMAHPKWSPQGDRVAVILQHFDSLMTDVLDSHTDVLAFSLIVADVESAATREITPKWYYACKMPEPFDWSPEGNRIAFTASMVPMSEERNTQELYLADLSGASPEWTRLTNNDVFDGNPAFSPNGLLLAFTRSTRPMGARVLVIHDLEKRTERELSTGDIDPEKGGFIVHKPSWSEDGTKVLFQGYWSNDPVRGSVYGADVETGTVTLEKPGEQRDWRSIRR